MPKEIWPFITFIVFFPIMFFCSLLYQNGFGAAKRAFKLDFSNFSRLELWLSIGIAVFISTLLAYSTL